MHDLPQQSYSALHKKKISTKNKLNREIKINEIE